MQFDPVKIKDKTYQPSQANNSYIFPAVGLAIIVTQARRVPDDRPTQAWTRVELANEATLSRSTFLEWFRREAGVAPMEYLLGWRVPLAKDLL